jgi:GT2 family glycosyltransferase
VTRVSVIIVNFNSGGALPRTLASLPDGLAGTEWDAIVVDNASSDGSERLTEGDVRIRLLRQQTNLGFAAGVNAGLSATSAPFVLVLNPDCRLQTGAGQRLLAEMLSWSDCAVVGPVVLDPSGSLQESARGDPTILTGLFGRTSLLSRLFPDLPVVKRNLAALPLSKSEEASHKVDWVSGACMLLRREAVDGVGGLDEGYFLYWEDADICRRLRQAGWQVRYTTVATVVHDVGQSSRNAKALANREFHRSAYRYFATYVVPQQWHPARILARTILMTRARLKAPSKLSAPEVPRSAGPTGRL